MKLMSLGVKQGDTVTVTAEAGMVKAHLPPPRSVIVISRPVPSVTDRERKRQPELGVAVTVTVSPWAARVELN